MAYIIKIKTGGYLREGLMGLYVVSEKIRATRFRNEESAYYIGHSYKNDSSIYKVVKV